LVCYVHVPMLLLTRLESTDGIGLFVVASSVAAAIAVFTGAASKVYFSEATRLTTMQEMTNLVAGVRKVLALSVVILVILEFVTPMLIPFIFGAEFAAAAILAAVLLVVSGISGASNVMDDLLKGRGFTHPGIGARLAYIFIVLMGTSVEYGLTLSQSLACAMLAGALVEYGIIGRAVARVSGLRVIDVILPAMEDFREMWRYLMGRVRAR